MALVTGVCVARVPGVVVLVGAAGGGVGDGEAIGVLRLGRESASCEADTNTDPNSTAEMNNKTAKKRKSELFEFFKYNRLFSNYVSPTDCQNAS